MIRPTARRACATVVARHADRAQPPRRRRATRVSVRASGLLSYETYRRALTPLIGPSIASRCGGRRTCRRRAASSSPGTTTRCSTRSSSRRRSRGRCATSARPSCGRCPGLRWWLGTVEAIPVHRGRSDIAAISSAIEALEADEVVGIFPEGGVGREGPWLRGAARMALATGAPLLPVRLLDTRKAFGRGRDRVPAARCADRRADRGRANGADGRACARADRPAAGRGRVARHVDATTPTSAPGPDRPAAGTLDRCQVAALEQSQPNAPSVRPIPPCARPTCAASSRSSARTGRSSPSSSR